MPDKCSKGDPKHHDRTCLTGLSIAVVISAVKMLMLHSYRSTDYEVHRNWLAITHSLPMDKWYQEKTSEWTLDYPPLFAWFEFCLSHVARYFDPQMLVVANLNYISTQSVLFHKLSVIASDLLFVYSATRFSQHCSIHREKGTAPLGDHKLLLAILLITNFGLFVVDHLHFQYNGFLFGLLLLSITCVFEGQLLTASLHFATLLNFKHIYLYVAPAYGVYLLRVYCFNSSKKDGRVLWSTFSPLRLSLLATTVLMMFGISLGPFIYLGQLQQVIARLFPFKRGLVHAYWAPNFWALYNAADKALCVGGQRLGYSCSHSQAAAMTGGLVQEFNHSVLPSIPPIITFLLTGGFMLPALVHLWINPSGPRSFLRCLIMCAFTSFLFGWHVHEKAILLVIIPLALLAVESKPYGRSFFLTSVIGNVSLFPLIFTHFEQPLLYSGFIAYTAYSFLSLKSLLITSGDSLLRSHERVYLHGLALVLLYYGGGHTLLGLQARLPFLPLLLVSVYTALGVTYCYVDLYWLVLSERMVVHLKRM